MIAAGSRTEQNNSLDLLRSPDLIDELMSRLVISVPMSEITASHELPLSEIVKRPRCAVGSRSK